MFSKRYANGKNIIKYIDEFNQALSQLEAMVEDAKIKDSHKVPILLASFGTDSVLEPAITALRMKEEIPEWESLMSDLVTEAARIGDTRKNTTKTLN